MKKLAAILLAAVTLLSAAGCSGKPADSAADTRAQFPAGQYDYKYQWYAGMTPRKSSAR